MSAKILLWDTETAANKAYVWGKYQQDVIAYDQEWYMLCFSYKWLGEKKTNVVSLPDFPGYQKDLSNDKKLVTSLWNLLNEADIAIGHNSAKFDHRKANARFAFHGLPPHSPVRIIDTLQIARRHFAFNCNRLDSLGELLGLGRKVPHKGFDLWKGCMSGDTASWKTMVKYAKGDVDLLEKIYLRLRPYSEDSVHVGLFEENPLGKCPCCGSANLIKRGYRVASTRVYKQYVCKDCGRWSRSVMSEKETKADLR